MMTKRKILVADASKVVRASLAKQLAEYFDVREEASGESAWQTLVLDRAIVGVVSGTSLTNLDGLGLLERVRASKLARLNSLPFFLVVSSSFGEEERAQARNRGVTDFVSKDSISASLSSVLALLQARSHENHGDSVDVALEVPPPVLDEACADTEEEVGVQTDVGITDILGQLGGVEGLEESAVGCVDDDALGNESPVGASDKLDEALAKSLVDAAEGNGVGILAFGLDRYDDLIAQHGTELVARTVQKFSFMVARKIRPEDVICQLPGGRVVIIASETTSATCVAFASRVCKAMAAAQIAVRGQRIDLTVSVGVAVLPEEGLLLSGQEVLNLAYNRLEDAQRDGGNHVLAKVNYQGSGHGSCQDFVPQLKALLASA